MDRQAFLASSMPKPGHSGELKQGDSCRILRLTSLETSLTETSQAKTTDCVPGPWITGPSRIAFSILASHLLPHFAFHSRNHTRFPYLCSIIWTIILYKSAEKVSHETRLDCQSGGRHTTVAGRRRPGGVYISSEIHPTVSQRLTTASVDVNVIDCKCTKPLIQFSLFHLLFGKLSYTLVPFGRGEGCSECTSSYLLIRVGWRNAKRYRGQMHP